MGAGWVWGGLWKRYFSTTQETLKMKTHRLQNQVCLFLYVFLLLFDSFFFVISCFCPFDFSLEMYFLILSIKKKGGKEREGHLADGLTWWDH